MLADYCDQCDGRLVVGSSRTPASEYCRCELLSEEHTSLTKSERAALNAVHDGEALLVDSDDLTELQGKGLVQLDTDQCWYLTGRGDLVWQVMS
jgi:hypothetical protein